MMHDLDQHLIPIPGFAAVMLCCLLAGCGHEAEPVPSASDTNAATKSDGDGAPLNTTPSDAQPVDIQLVAASWSDIESAIASHQNRVVVVDLWSTSCIPCIAELPRLGELQRTFDDVVCISVSVDYVGIKSKPAETYRERVEGVLQRCNVSGLNYLCTTDSDTVFANLDLSAIPAVFVYNQKGAMVQRFDDSLLTEESENDKPFTYEQDVIPLVERLLQAD